MNYFILGMGKCGTSSLADWMVANKLADYLIAGVKEPYIFAQSNLPCIPLNSEMPILDASPGYATNLDALGRIPEHNSRLVLCLRNQFERTWSAYKMKKLYVSGGSNVSKFIDKFPTAKGTRAYFKSSDVYDIILSTVKLHYPRKSTDYIDKYFDFEWNQFSKQTFVERINYEIAFLLKRRMFPLISILNDSFYTFPIKNILSRFHAKDLFLVSVNKFNNNVLRDNFAQSLCDVKLTTTPLLNNFTLIDIDIGEDKPDFKSSEWNFLRYFFKEDLVSLFALLNDGFFMKDYIDIDDLKNNII